jgi:pimeloyl-ACP methyl ester carboxylesterase
MAGSAATWREVEDSLAEDHLVLAPDLLGHGRSDKPNGDYSLGAHASVLRDLLVALSIESATLIGHSLGGGIAMQMAYQYPDRADRLVLVGSGGLGREVSPLLRMLTLPGSELVLPLLFPALAAEHGNKVSTWIRDRGVKIPRLEETWRAYVGLTQGANRTAFVKTLRAVIDLGGQSVSAHDRLYLAAAMPTLIVWGDRDAIIPVQHAYDAHEAMPGSRLDIIEGVGHFAHVEAPARFLATLRDFLATTEPLAESDSAWRSMLLDQVG